MISSFTLENVQAYSISYSTLYTYKQTILPIFVYPGYVLWPLNKGKKHNLQILQNDALRFAKGVKLVD